MLGITHTSQEGALSLNFNWLQVVGPAERAQIDQRVRHHLPPIVPRLDTFKASQQPLQFILPGTGPFDTHAYRMDGGVEEAYASTRCRLPMARVFLDVGTHARIENAL